MKVYKSRPTLHQLSFVPIKASQPALNLDLEIVGHALLDYDTILSVQCREYIVILGGD
jgi:hypothetical protein